MNALVRFPSSTRRCAALAAACLASLLLCPVSSQAALPATNPFPPRDLRVSTDQSTSGILKLRLENLDTQPVKERHAEVQQLFIAGSPKKIPSTRVTQAHYYLVRDGKFVQDRYDVPPLQSGSEAKQNVLRVTDVGVFRQYHVYGLALSTVITAADDYWVADYVELELDLGAPPNSDSAAKISPDANGSLAAEALVNPQIDPGYYEPAAASLDFSSAERWTRQVNQVLDEGGRVYKIRLYKPGPYALTSQTLGLGQADKLGDTSTWRLFHRGEEVALLETQTSAGRSAVFLAEKFDTVAQGEDVYWLFLPAQLHSPTPAKRFATLTSSPLAAQTPPTSSPTRARFEHVEEKLLDYHGRLRPTSQFTRWFWQSISEGKTTLFTVNLPSHFHPAPGDQVSVELAYSTPPPTGPLASFELFVNGSADQMLSATQPQSTLTFHVPASSLKPGKNELGVRLHYPEGTGPQQDLLVHRFVFGWEEPLGSPEQLHEPFELAETSSTAPLEVRFSAKAPQGEQVYLLDAGQSAAQRVLQPIAQSGQGEQELVFDAPGASKGPFYALVPEVLPAPPQVQRAARLELLNPAWKANYLAIAYGPLLEPLRPLLERRRQQGLTPLATDVETVFDHFSYGIKDPQAIKSFLAYAFYHWSAPRLEYAVLVGEASEYRGDPAELPPQGQLDQVPVFANSHTDTAHGDHNYTTICGADCLSDLALGRLSVATDDELTSLVAKIVAYEQAPSDPWLLKSLFVCDDDEEFPKVASQVISRGTIPSANVQRLRQADYGYVPYLRVPGKRRSWQATHELVERFNSGVGLINYIGHGGPNLWTHERLLHLADLALLHNTPLLPFITCASCDNAWLDYPVAPVTASMGELFLRDAAGGGIGVFAPVSGASPYEHATLLSRLMEGVFKQGIRRIGDLTLYAKNFYYLDTHSSGIPEQYALLGDPALKLRIPQFVPDLKIQPQAVAANTPVAVHVELEEDGLQASQEVLSIRSLLKPDEVLTRPVTLRAQTARTQFDLPQGLAPGSYAVELPHKTLTGQMHAHVARLEVDTPALCLTSERLTTAAVAEPNQNVAQRVRLANPTHLDFPDAFVRISHMPAPGTQPNDAQSLFYDSMGIKAQGYWQSTFDWLPTMPDKLQADFGCAFRKENMQTAPALSVVRRNSKAPLSVCVPGDAMRLNRNPVNEFDPPSFSFELWNNGSRVLQNATGKLTQNGQLICDPVPIASLLPAAHSSLNFTSQKPFSPGEQRVRLEVCAPDASTSASAPKCIYALENSFHVARGVDLEFVPGSARAWAKDTRFISRASVFVEARLKNSGETPANNVSLHLLQENPEQGSEAKTLNDQSAVIVDQLLPGETKTVTFRWEDNAMRAGEKKLWLVANRHHGIRENNYKNNQIAVAPFDVKQVGNFVVDAFEVRPHYALAGEALKFNMSVALDGETTRGPVDVEFGLRNPLTGEKKTLKRTVAQIGAGGRCLLEGQLAMDPAYSVAFATVNPAKEQEELNAGDNTTQTELLPLNRLEQFTTDAQGRYELRQGFAGSLARNIELMPGGDLRLASSIDSSQAASPIELAWVCGGTTVSASETTDSEHDGRWSVRPGYMIASTEETAGPVQIDVPAVACQGVRLFDVYVAGVAVGRNGRAGVCESALGNSTSFKKHDFSQQPGVQQNLYLGRQASADGRIRITLRTPPATGAAFSSIELVPIMGSVESQVLVLPAESVGHSAQLHFADLSASTSAIHYAYRCGKRLDDGTIAWEAWREQPSKELSIDHTAPLLQWRALLFGGDGNAPTLHEAQLTIGGK